MSVQAKPGKPGPQPPSKPIYLAANPAEAQLVRDYLGHAGVAVTVRGSYAWGGMGDLPFVEAYPRLYLDDERDRARAEDLIRRYESGSEARGVRRCAACGEDSPGNFAVCWSCGAAIA